MAQLKRPWLWREETDELIQSGATAAHGQAAQSKKAVSMANVPSLQDRSQPDRKITLEDIKVVGVNLVSEGSLLSTHKRVALLFDQCYRTNQMNHLLWSSLAYFDAYQYYSETSRNATSGVAGMKHQQALKVAQEKLSKCQASLGKAYSLFILGLDHWKSHHSLGGRSRVSKTQTDQMFFEILYEFVLLCIWICFGYDNWEIIRKEMGRVFRTSAYCRDYDSGDQSVAIDGLGPVTKNSDEYIAYRVHFERPPVGSLKCLRSPALENILPSHNKMTRSSESDGSKGWPWSRENEEIEELGIIGQQLSEYDPQSLKPLAKSHFQDDSGASDSDVDDSQLDEDHDVLSLHS